MKTFLALGLMSGTSMDGVDAALLETDGQDHIKELEFISIPYDKRFQVLLKAAEYSVRRTAGDLQLAAQNFSIDLNHYLCNELAENAADYLTNLKDYLQSSTEITLATIIDHSTKLHQEAIQQLLNKAQRAAHQLAVIGYHGQTLYHAPANQITIQIGNAQMLANAFKVRVVSDFRTQDIALGGQGAPLAPIYHLALCKRAQCLPAAIVNCGGIANITIMPDSDPTHMLGFDTGPGNCLLDRFVRTRTQNQFSYDLDGKFGMHGQVNEAVLEDLYLNSCLINGKNYFQFAPPKSLDSHDLKLTPALEALSLEDGCATLAAFTARTIVDSFASAITSDLMPLATCNAGDSLSGMTTQTTGTLCLEPALQVASGIRSRENFNSYPKYWILAGGGWYNLTIRRYFEEYLTSKADCIIKTADELGWHNQAIEAQLMAYIAVRRLQELPITFPNTTQVAKPISGGTLSF